MEKTTDSKVEKAKQAGRHLRGTIAETLGSAATHFGDDDATLLKFHGTYQQDDRDRRRDREAAGLEKAYIFMARVALPAGVLTAEQYLAFDTLASEYGNDTLRVTTRQGFQFHAVVKGNLKATIAGVAQTLATTLAACGDVERNVMGCPAPLDDNAHRAVRDIAHGIASDLRPASRAYYEIWLDGEKQISTEPEEPFYGARYLPRKFKTAIGLSTDNCVDIYSHDAGLLGVVSDGELLGFNLLVGGGLGMTHNKGDTFARLAEPLAFVSPAEAVEGVRTVAAIFRDHGNRSDRRHARLKYLLAEWGIDRFREEFQRRISFPIRPPLLVAPPPFHDHLGRHRQDGGKWFYGVFIQSGRISDTPRQRLKTALRRIVARHRPSISLTGQQNLLFTGLDFTATDDIERTLLAHGVIPAPDLSAARRFSMACPALPTCGLALAESERLLPSIVDLFEAELESLGVRQEPITIRMTGCPNGCARPYTADIAFVGRSLGLYNVYVGGSLAADRVADLYRAEVPSEDLLEVLKPLLSRWAEERTPGEGLGDFYQRLLGPRAPRVSLTGREKPTAELVQLGAAR